MAHEISDTLDISILTIVQQCLDGEIDSGQAMKRVRRAQRFAQIARYQVPIRKGEKRDRRNFDAN